MLIAIDIGNSRVKTGVFKKNKLIDNGRFGFFKNVLTYLKIMLPDAIAISTVVPFDRKIINDKIKMATGKYPFIISHKCKTNLKIAYKTPESLGVDRLCSAEGAFYLFKRSQKYKNYKKGTFIISIDFGTATTVNVIEYPGKFIGGLIAPGLDMMFESLTEKTAQLPHLDISSFKSTIGNDTKSSIASGVVTSVVGMIEKSINNLKKEKSAKDVFVYLTGGNAKKIIPYLKFDFVYEEGLVLYGINALWELKKK